MGLGSFMIEVTRNAVINDMIYVDTCTLWEKMLELNEEGFVINIIEDMRHDDIVKKGMMLVESF